MREHRWDDLVGWFEDVDMADAAESKERRAGNRVRRGDAVCEQGDWIRVAMDHECREIQARE